MVERAVDDAPKLEIRGDVVLTPAGPTSSRRDALLRYDHVGCGEHDISVI
jgi:hypothetical protein